ncbi:hypothetical protein ACFS7Z_03785 [Pontibacter toksunensis]|uniref:Uncharacterized protein n=1 Tax=Pontibacter toksunensis TaxID=1332631 RepID=A0ABW6BQF3_9BACT
MVNANNDKPLFELSIEKLLAANIPLILEKRNELSKIEQELEGMGESLFGMNFLSWKEGETLALSRVDRERKQKEVSEAKQELEKLEEQVGELLPVKGKDISIAAKDKPYSVCYITDKYGNKRQLIIKQYSN